MFWSSLKIVPIMEILPDPSSEALILTLLLYILALLVLIGSGIVFATLLFFSFNLRAQLLILLLLIMGCFFSQGMDGLLASLKGAGIMSIAIVTVKFLSSKNNQVE